MNIRTHQQDFDRTIAGIINGSGVRDIVAHVTPGGGKSTLPIQAGRLITAGLADRICWICPRASLQDQAERNFIDPRFRQMFGHNLVIRQATNDHNPSRGTAGFVTTYQALGVDQDQTVLRDFERHRYILILDEFHHLAVDGEWTEPIRELYDRAVFRVLMTGTLQRGDEKRIAFLPYEQTGENEYTPSLRGRDDNLAPIFYTRRGALADCAVIPLEFHFADGVASWRKESGRETTSRLSTGRGDANQALYTAIKTEYAQELLAAGVYHWRHSGGSGCIEGGMVPSDSTFREGSGLSRTVAPERPGHATRPSGSLLVVAASIESAKEYTEILKRQGLHAEIATSDDTPQAIKQIKALKAGKLKILVTVAMAYEGMDCPSISHIVCLTNIRSLPWIEQMVARANRIDPQAGPYESQRGFIFAPADRMFVELARKIEADQCEAVAKQKAPAEVREGAGNGNGGGPHITPLSSKLIAGQADLFGYIPFSPYNPGKTQREIETELREEIDSHVRGWSRAFGYLPTNLNGRIKREFGKCRENMTVKELEAVKVWLGENYQVPERREPMTVLQPIGAGRIW